MAASQLFTFRQSEAYGLCVLTGRQAHKRKAQVKWELHCLQARLAISGACARLFPWLPVVGGADGCRKESLDSRSAPMSEKNLDALMAELHEDLKRALMKYGTTAEDIDLSGDESPMLGSLWEFAYYAALIASSGGVPEKDLLAIASDQFKRVQQAIGKKSETPLSFDAPGMNWW